MQEQNKRGIALAHGRSLDIGRDQKGEERIEIRSPSGEIEISVVLTAEGAKVRLRALDLEMDAARAIRMRCETFELAAARDVKIHAQAGGIAMEANDDLDMKGERILPNSDAKPMPLTWDELEARTGRRVNEP